MSEADALEEWSDEGCSSFDYDYWVSGRYDALPETKIEKHIKMVSSKDTNLHNMRCHCGNTYYAKPSDLLRGWGLSCSKRCSALRRERNLPKGKKL